MEVRHIGPASDGSLHLAIRCRASNRDTVGVFFGANAAARA
jgi:hypothetical protein